MNKRTALLGSLVFALLALACWHILASLRYSWHWENMWEQREILLRGWLLTIGIAAAALVGTLYFAAPSDQAGAYRLRWMPRHQMSAEAETTMELQFVGAE